MFPAIVIGLMLASCALPPATVYRRIPSAVAAGSDDAQLHRLVAEAIGSADEADAKRALGLLVERWHTRRLGATYTLRPGASGGPSYRVTIAEASAGCYPYGYFDVLKPAGELRVARIPHYRRDGVGAPLVALRENLRAEPIEWYYPPEAITRPLTALASAGPEGEGVREVTIRLLCPLTNDTVQTSRGRQPLAADFSAPWASLLARTGDLQLRGMFDAWTSTPSRPPRLYLMEPYDPQKEPLIMIHGLYATPLIWSKLSNELWADPAIRHRYQLWHYHYNTSAPALYSARRLREQLREVRALLDPGGRDPALRRTTVLAHSMGGLIAKALAVRPGHTFWDAAFTVSPDRLTLSPADRAMLHEAFEWQADPSIHRLIFVAVPHRGSDYADNAIGRIGRWLTAPPQEFREFYERVSAANPGVFTPAYEELGSGRLNSVSSLSPSQPTLQILADLPFAHPVKVHSIIGNRGRSGPIALSSDGVVAYASSHVEGAESELIVPAKHWTYSHPAAVAEIKRILTLPGGR